MADRRRIEKLLFVYNADSGKWSAFVDSAKKLFRIQGWTLCSITHGLAGEKEQWRDCRDEIGVPVDYVHRDELGGKLGEIAEAQLPCVVAETGGDLVFLLGPDVLQRCSGSVADFKGRLFTYAAMHELEFPPPQT
ncbi:MAG TPA: hypothetical protein VM534_09780 [Thermoanaerobaculia bacterium]|nr:hypothetical protein [Thermoanaerobaculia bacterium]